MTELKEGMYVRTKYGIAKYIRKLVTKTTIFYVVDKKIVYDNVEDWEDVLASGEIKKASYNIIDLIKVGDYVNGDMVVDIEENGWISFSNNSYHKCNFVDSVVTKEQFESMSYKVGE